MLPHSFRASKVASLFLVFLSLAAVSWADGLRWTQATPFGGSMEALAQAPSAPRVLYTTASYRLFFASEDGGATWRRRPPAPVPGLREMFVDSQEPRTIYARTATYNEAGLVRSRDGGFHWSSISAALPGVLALAADPAAPHGLWAATKAGLYQTADGGDSWRLAAFEGLNVLSLAADPGNSAKLLAAVGDTSFPLLWRSADHGASWSEMSPPFTEFVFDINSPRFTYDPARPDTIYLFFPPLLTYFDFVWAPAYRSTDGGASWELLPQALGARGLLSLPNGLLLAATDSGISRSSDRGDTWSPPLRTSEPGRPNDAFLRIAEDLSGPGKLFALGSAGVWKSGDSGANWQASSQGIDALPVASLAAVPTGPDTVIAAAGTSLFSSADQGASWTRLHSSSSDLQPDTVEVIDPRDPLTMYGIFPRDLDDIVVRSTDGGVSWDEFPNPYHCSGGSLCSVSIGVLALDPENPDSVFVAGSYFFHFGGMGNFLESGHGESWKNLHAIRNLRTLAFAPGRKGAMFGIHCSGLFQSANRGVSWRKIGAGLPKALCGNRVKPQLAIDPRDPRRIYLGSGAGVFASSDGGLTFRAMNKGLETAGVSTLLIDPSDPSRLYAAVPLRGVFRWKAGLRTWAPLNAGLPLATFNGVLALDPQNPSILYAGTADRGVFRLDLQE